jgi:hypothetical protein
MGWFSTGLKTGNWNLHSEQRNASNSLKWRLHPEQQDGKKTDINEVNNFFIRRPSFMIFIVILRKL